MGTVQTAWLMMQLPQRPGRYPASRAIGVDHILIDDGGSSLAVDTFCPR